MLVEHCWPLALLATISSMVICLGGGGGGGKPTMLTRKCMAAALEGS